MKFNFDNLVNLTPKGPYVLGVTKPVLVSVAWPHTIFRFFETFCEDASRRKLCVSTNFTIFGPMDQKLWVFEDFRQGLAKAGMCWSQWGGVDHIRKKWGKEAKKRNGSLVVQGAYAVAGGRLLVASRPWGVWLLVGDQRSPTNRVACPWELATSSFL
jgi:hypothetical protein